ncbi:NADH-quinone oxidoreductase subunit N [Thalassobacillus devorans]|uniref:NADH-quinone oxidoreductase subunit N n=1 Tax=Thalassobacillus devorans TaxID=279813 RepID=A0ABQ1NWI2_9BACI|nr:NADH-quinone oxidoreductase subunit NuoN [Thalassobacillus devorans]NIK28483.1 NADH-quinone oxidoreductase subunit N [Thalassobacillus devorans]GGC85855.1 NADH-quinone oxidoreductase subunit N [Thalassobacillus devorans]
MDMETLLSYEWSMMAPEFTILIIATVLSLVDLFADKKIDRKLFGWFGAAGIGIALFFLFSQIGHEPAMILANTYRLDAFSLSFKILLLIGALLVLLMGVSYEAKGELLYRGEFYYLLMSALLGAMMMASSADLITLFVGLELLSISSYILAGTRKKSTQSNEAAMKYVINGGISSAFTLFGLSYIYGLTGSTNLADISREISNIAPENGLVLLSVAFILTFVGLAFKISTVPFQMWAPDVYQGAPIPVTVFLSVVSKTAGFVIILRVLLSVFPFAQGLEANTSLLQSMMIFISVLAGITMIAGNTVALKQRNIKRLFAYSSIAHAGYLLVPFVAFSEMMFESMWFYLAAYLLMNIGAFAVIQVMSEHSHSEDISIFAGLFYRRPWMAVMMTIFLLSLAGIPGTAGFIGKLNIFIGALFSDPSRYILAAVMMGTTVISYFYYFGVMAQMFMRPSGSAVPIRMPVGVTIAMVFCAAGTITLGLFPGVVLDFFQTQFNFAEMFY